MKFKIVEYFSIIAQALVRIEKYLVTQHHDVHIILHFKCLCLWIRPPDAVLMLVSLCVISNNKIQKNKIPPDIFVPAPKQPPPPAPKQPPP